MKVRTLTLALVLGFVGTTLCIAQNPNIGTWKLNEAKSQIPAGSTKNSTVVYEQQGDSIKVTTDGTRAGQPIHSEWTGKFDDKDYPVTGDSTADSRSYKKINDHTLTFANKMGGKAVVTGRIVVAPDGKTRTVNITTTDSAGKKTTGTAIYDKQ